MRILVVEDEPELRAAIARRLRAQGHGVDEAGDGATAEFLLKEFPPALIILDRMLPDGDSLERLESWRQSGNETPALFLTALDHVVDRVRGFASGADDYLVKPFAMEELLARVGAILRRQAAPRPSLQTVGDLEIELSRREVRRAGTLIPLRPKEYALIELLASREGQVVTRADIMGACWDEAHEPLSNVDEVLVASVRRKLGQPQMIRTVRGSGYILEGGDGDS